MSHSVRSKYSTVLSLGVIIGVGSVASMSQLKAQDGGFRLTVVPESIDVSYNVPVVDHHLFFTGEPVRVTVKLINHTREEFTPRDKRPLADQIIKTVQTRQTPKRDGGPVTVPAVGWSRIGLPRHSYDGTSPIPARNYAEMRWSLASGPQDTLLPPGIYDVTVRYSLRPDHELNEKVAIEVREPQTRADQMDALLHKAIRARWDADLSGAERYLKQLLGLNPVSAAAYNELAAVYLGMGNCAASQAAVDQTITLIQNRADRESFVFSNSFALNDWLAGLRTARQSCR